MVREFGVDVYTLLYLEWITNMNLLYSTGNTDQCYPAAWIGGELGGEWLHVWLSPFAVPLKLPRTITTLLTGYTTIQNKKLKPNCFL